MVGLSGYRLNKDLDQNLATSNENHSHYTESKSLPKAHALSMRLTKQQKADAVAAYEAGASTREIAAVWGVSKSGINRLLVESGQRVRPRTKLTPEQIVEAGRLYESGLLLREIGARFGVSRDCVRIALKARGIALRPGLGARRSAPGS